MSGPKVVRIITRQELLTQCISLLRQLDQSIVFWSDESSRLGTIDECVFASIQKRRAKFETMIAADQFTEVQAQIPLEIAFLEKNIEQFRKKAEEALVLERKKTSQQRQHAFALLTELQANSQIDHQEILALLNKIATGIEITEDIDKILTKGFSLLSSKDSINTLSDIQASIAKQLLPDEETQPFDAWKAIQKHSKNPRFERIHSALSELETHFGKQATTTFSIRFNALENEPEGAACNLRLDTLLYDIKVIIQTFKQKEDFLQKARNLNTELSLISAHEGSDLDLLRFKLQEAITIEDLTNIHSLIQAGYVLLSALRDREAAQARRNAILSGLSVLGYEVREGMASACVKQGRLILHKPGLDYGVEIDGSSDAARLQIRPVVFSSNRDTHRDPEIETLWCGDFQKLQTIISNQGGAVIIEKEMAIGSTPLKTITLIEDNSEVTNTLQMNVPLFQKS